MQKKCQVKLSIAINICKWIEHLGISFNLNKNSLFMTFQRLHTSFVHFRSDLLGKYFLRGFDIGNFDQVWFKICMNNNCFVRSNGMQSAEDVIYGNHFILNIIIELFGCWNRRGINNNKCSEINMHRKVLIDSIRRLSSNFHVKFLGCGDQSMCILKCGNSIPTSSHWP